SSAGPSLFNPNTDSAAATVNFPVGFTFPYFGQTYSAVRVTSKGFISFDLNASSLLTNYPLPNATYRYVHLSPFWDDLYSQANGKAVTEFRPNPDRFIIQWSNYGRYYPSSNRNWNLNFQIVLFPDGSFEYRYGTMDPPPGGATSTSDCNPLSCVDEANGSSATIGFQGPFPGSPAFQLHYGGASIDNYPPFPGGLANRTFRYVRELPNAAGSFHDLVVNTSDEEIVYRLCIRDADWEECVERPLQVLSKGDLMITEVMPAPNDGNAEWIEI